MRTVYDRFQNRKRRVRKAISQVSSKTSLRYRLSVFKSNRHIYTQIIDDSRGITLFSASTLADWSEFKISNSRVRPSNLTESRVNKAVARNVGELISKRASEFGISKIVFDRGGYAYHGVVKAVADGARTHLDF